jgi:hypothetical protein
LRLGQDPYGFQETSVTERLTRYEAKSVEGMILALRGQRIILDRDLAAIYGVPTYRFNEAVKRNRRRFPKDFIFRLTSEELAGLTSQIAMSKPGRGGRRTLPYAFTEHGAVMAANILRSERAVQMSVFVVRAFVRMRQMLGEQRDLAAKLAALEERLTGRLDAHETAIEQVLRQIRRLLNPPLAPEPPRKQIGFRVREPRMRYSTKPSGK